MESQATKMITSILIILEASMRLSTIVLSGWTKRTYPARGESFFPTEKGKFPLSCGAEKWRQNFADKDT